jgi:hypothetical protein
MPEGIDSAAIEISNLATTAAASAWLWGGNFLVLIILTFVLFFFAMHQGRSGLITVNLSMYAGYALYVVFPYRESIIAIGSTAMVQAFLSILLFIFATIPPFVIILRLTAPSFGSLSIIQNLLLSVLAASFLMALAYHVFDISHVFTLPDPLNQIFAPKGYFFYWFIAPLVGLWFLAR